MSWAIVVASVLSTLATIRSGLGSLVADYKTELLFAAVVVLALVFASAFDRWLIVGAVIVSFLAGSRWAMPVAAPSVKPSTPAAS